MAKEVKAIAGHVYTVTSPNGCTVTNENGKTLNTVDAGTQKDVRAISGVLVIDDEEGEITKAVNFKGAGAKLRLLGAGVNALPAGYLRADFLESTGTQHLTINCGTQPGDTVRLATDMQFATLPQSRSAEGVSQGGRTFFIGAYPETWYAGAGFAFGQTNQIKTDIVRHKCVLQYAPDFSGLTVDDDIVFSTAYKEGFTLSETGSLGVWHTPGNWYVLPSRKFNWELKVNNKTAASLVPALEKGTPCMFDKVSKQPFRNSGTGQFIVGFTLEQARKLGKHLPEGGGELTVSLPWEAQLVQHNAEVEASLQTAKSKGWTITVQYREPEPDSKVYNKYADCATAADMQAVNADYKNDLTKDGAWVYKLPKMTNLNSAFAGSEVRRFAVELPKVTSLQRAFEGSKIEFFKSAAPKHNRTGFSITFSGCKSLEVVDCDMSNAEEIFENFFSCPKLRVVTSSFPKVNTMYRAFNGTQLDKESSVRILTSVPSPVASSTRYTINIGIHVDLKADEDVVAAIAAAEEKGWVVAAQWNGTPGTSTASTYRLRRNPVYAKLGEPMEDGKPHLDWGHYVTNAEENGYTEFTSLEEAKEHFNINQTEEV